MSPGNPLPSGEYLGLRDTKGSGQLRRNPFADGLPALSQADSAHRDTGPESKLKLRPSVILSRRSQGNARALCIHGSHLFQ